MAKFKISNKDIKRNKEKEKVKVRDRSKPKKQFGKKTREIFFKKFVYFNYYFKFHKKKIPIDLVNHFLSL